LKKKCATFYLFLANIKIQIQPVKNILF